MYGSVAISPESGIKTLEYGKIETIWNRDEKTFKVKPGAPRWREFEALRFWHVTEKIDGTNIRVSLGPGQFPDNWRAEEGALVKAPSRVTFGGRTDAAQIQASVVQMLQGLFPAEKVAGAFDVDTTAILFGEAYGPKIQKGGGLYRADVGFRLFDVVVFDADGRPWWLTWENVENVAKKLGIKTVPVLNPRATLEEAVAHVYAKSATATEDGGPGLDQEGIVARSEPPLFTRAGRRLCWKLKVKDF